MSAPTELAQHALKRMARDLRLRPRLIWRYDYQRASSREVYAGMDWAGCVRTRKSTCGVCSLPRNHVLKTRRATPASLALTSGEAEFYGVVNGAGIGLGQAALFDVVGIKLPLRVWTDSPRPLAFAAGKALANSDTLPARPFGYSSVCAGDARVPTLKVEKVRAHSPVQDLVR